VYKIGNIIITTDFSPIAPDPHFYVHAMQATYPLSNPSSPIRPRKKGAPIPGFRVPPKPKRPPIEELTIRELRDLYDRNAKILATPSVDHFCFCP
jgi:hypothetical protein